MKEKSFRIYIQRLLKFSHPEFHIGKVALELINNILKVFNKNLTQKSITLTVGSDKRTIAVKDLETSLKILFSHDVVVSDKIVEFAEHACEEYQNTLLEKSISKEKGNSDEKNSTRETRAHLIFSVSTAEKYLRCFGQNNLHVASQAPVFLAAVNEYIATVILNLAQKHTALDKKSTIQIRHIFSGVTEDSVLNALFQKLNVIFLGAEQNRGSSQSTRTPKTTTTVKSTKFSSLLMQHAPFNRLVREIGKMYDADEKDAETRYTRKFMICMQMLIEERMIRLMQGAVQMCAHDGRDTVYARDIILSKEFMEPMMNITHEVPDTKIAEAAIRKMAARAGTKRYGEDCTELYRKIFVGYVHDYLRMIVMCLNLRKLRTINIKQLMEVANLKDQNILLVTNVSKKRRRQQRTSSSESVAESVAESVESVESTESSQEESESEDEELTTQLDDISETHETHEDSNESADDE